jgi:hypothetical protein
MGDDLTTQILKAVRLRMQTQAEFTEELLDEIVDEVVDEFTRDGLISDQSDTESLKNEVLGRLREEREGGGARA